ncbi:MAG: thioredoxin family protein [Armatimonadetes bacterium]|nr:thioredoxin family protein [Armatimonadota bacterium]NIM22952.1 thioredoxin family protein [Armatimonadota bacterium]NIM66823.1 thioredoxin family protein [Armatimonadota bacterium]NIM75364.1 thioredoxin family protein [Armatimonadota bacterium]NIN05011.1 thioredoxin family protein [Armatimonadota bacterium]
MKKVQVLGSGCPKCEETAANAKAAAAAVGVEIKIEKVKKPAEIAKLGVLFTPGLAIEGEVKVSGRVPTVDEIKPWLTKAS